MKTITRFIICASITFGVLFYLLPDDKAVSAKTSITRVFNVSAYCSCQKCCGIYSDGITASGHVLKPGDKIVAAGKIYPFGTKVFIEGYGLATVQDRGGAIKDDCFDLYFNTHQEALNWGRQYIECEVIE